MPGASARRHSVKETPRAALAAQRNRRRSKLCRSGAITASRSPGSFVARRRRCSRPIRCTRSCRCPPCQQSPPPPAPHQRLRPQLRAAAPAAECIGDLVGTRPQGAFEHRPGTLPHLFEQQRTTNAVDEAPLMVDVHGFARVDGGRQRSRGTDLRRVEPCLRSVLSEHSTNTAEEPTPAVRNDHRVNVGQVLENLQSDGGVAGP